MEKRIVAQELKKIEMTKEIKKRLIMNCYSKTENNVKKKYNGFLKKPATVAASLVVCFCLAGITVFAATGKIQGFFKDIKRFDGAVVGTSYESASEEIAMTLVVQENELIISFELLNTNISPYREIEKLGIEHYQIVDAKGNEILEGNVTVLADIKAGTATIHISLDIIPDGEYTLCVDALVGNAKAEQPLVIEGKWECGFLFEN